ncbi:MAG: hypothetical protein Kapaf2KO_21260 [Candidatus Kapaibacteriales bacterium]
MKLNSIKTLALDTIEEYEFQLGQNPKSIKIGDVLSVIARKYRWAGSKDRAFLGFLLILHLKFKSSSRDFTLDYIELLLSVSKHPDIHIYLEPSKRVKIYIERFLKDIEPYVGNLESLAIQRIQSANNFWENHIERIQGNWISASKDDLAISLIKSATIDIKPNYRKLSPSSYRELVTRLSQNHLWGKLIKDSAKLPYDSDIVNSEHYMSGEIDIMDEGSRAIVDLLITQFISIIDKNENSKVTILDYCCGAGGKSLEIYNRIGDKCDIYIYDIDDRKLAETNRRFEIAGYPTPKIFSNDNMPAEGFNIILVDAPCSSSGTVRRRPELLDLLNEKIILEYATLQFQLLKKVQVYLKKGGSLIYSTCSLFEEENENVIERFLSLINTFSRIDGSNIEVKPEYLDSNGNLHTHPAIHSTDGFFASVLTAR